MATRFAHEMLAQEWAEGNRAVESYIMELLEVDQQEEQRMKMEIHDSMLTTKQYLNQLTAGNSGNLEFDEMVNDLRKYAHELTKWEYTYELTNPLDPQFSFIVQQEERKRLRAEVYMAVEKMLQAQWRFYEWNVAEEAKRKEIANVEKSAPVVNLGDSLTLCVLSKDESLETNIEIAQDSPLEDDFIGADKIAQAGMAENKICEETDNAYAAADETSDGEEDLPELKGGDVVEMQKAELINERIDTSFSSPSGFC